MICIFLLNQGSFWYSLSALAFGQNCKCFPLIGSTDQLHFEKITQKDALAFLKK